MKTLKSKIVLGSMFLLMVAACNKSEYTGSPDEAQDGLASPFPVTDSISTAATMQVEGKRFIKTAEVDMEVKDVYEATVAIEKSLQEMGGFVTTSRLNSRVISEETFNTSDENAVMLRKFQTENNMQVRVPTEKLGVLLQFINDRKIFLNSRVILAEDVTANIELAKLEADRIKSTANNISQIQANKDKVKLGDQNMAEGNYQKVSNMQMSDRLKYSTVDIFLKEPNVRVAEIAVTNLRNMDNKYKSNFLYESTNAFVEGFYLTQKLIVGLVTLWPLLLVGALIIYLLRRRKINLHVKPQLSDK